MHLSSEASVLIVDVVTNDATPPVRRFRTFGSFSAPRKSRSKIVKPVCASEETRIGGLRRRDT